MIDPNTLFLTLKIIGAAGSAAATVFATVKFLVRPIKKKLAARKKAAEERDAKLDEILKEVRPNGGGSIKDAVSRMENAICQIQSVQRSRLNHEATCFFDMDKGGAITWTNKAALRALDATESDLLGLNYRSQIDAEDRARVVQEIREAVAEERDLKTFFRAAGRCWEMSLLAVKGGKETVSFTGSFSEREAGHCEGQ